MQISTNAFASDATLAMKVFAKPSAERNSLLILARETVGLVSSRATTTVRY